MNKIKSILIMGIFFASIFMILNPVSAATYNVNPGDDIEAIIGSALSGDTIYVHAGTYLVDEITLNADNITIIGDDPYTTIIDVSSGGDEGIDGVGRDYITVKNITVKNANNDGIDVNRYSVIENCIVYASGDNGFEVDNYSTLTNCISYDNGADGFEVYDYCTLKNCLSYDNSTDGFADNGHCTYINCTAVNNSANGFGDVGGGTKVTNCIAVGNVDGFDIENVTNPSEITYSNAWNNTGNNYDEAPAGTGSISVDPKFVNGIDTFYLSVGSPCVDKGSESSATLGLYNGFTTRIDGIWDKGTVDMGFHYASNRGPSSSLPIAKILDILKGNQDNE
ncbi:MAG: hypothetical protein GYA51_01605 [Candidatus Methanofastidiosa archaeon]|nr:hypothetical protein [Candidatus Methanofastidiosa archaeon]